MHSFFFRTIQYKYLDWLKPMNLFTPCAVPIMSETDRVKKGTQEKEDEYELRRSPRKKGRSTSSSVPAKTVTSEVLFYYVIIQIIHAYHKYYSSCLFSSIKYITFGSMSLCASVTKRYLCVSGFLDYI